MFKCCNCNETFETPLTIHDDFENYYGVGGLFGMHHPYTYEVCPYCKSEEIKEEPQYGVDITNVHRTNDGIAFNYQVFDESGALLTKGDDVYTEPMPVLNTNLLKTWVLDNECL